MKQPASGGNEAASNKSRARNERGARSGRSSSSVSNSSLNLAAGAKRPRRPLSTPASGAPPRAGRGSGERERPVDDSKTAGPDPQVADMHVLVPVQDVVAVPLTEISQAAADSLGGGEATRVSIERFCKTLQSVCRTEFSVKVDRANAGLVLGGRRPGNAASRSSRAAGGGALEAAQRAEAGTPVASEVVSTAEQANASPGDKGKRGKWGLALRLGKPSKAADGGEEDTESPPAQKKAAAVLAGKKNKTRNGGGGGGSGGAGKRRNGGGPGGDADSADEIAVVPLLQLVEELVQNAMFSPIGARDVMMSQARREEKRTRTFDDVTSFVHTCVIVT